MYIRKFQNNFQKKLSVSSILKDLVSNFGDKL